MTLDRGSPLADAGDHPSVVLEAQLRPRPQVIVRQVGDWSMLIDVDNGFTYETNRLGSQVWQALDGAGAACTLRQICAEVATAHAMAPEAVAADVLAFARDLVRFGLVSVDQGA